MQGGEMLQNHFRNKVRGFLNIFRRAEESWHSNFIENLVKTMQPKIYAEVGVFEGETLNKVLKYVNRAYAADINPTCFEFLPKSSKIITIHGDSENLANNIKHNNDQIELLFIDANHERSFVQKDFENLLPFLAVNAIVLFHDTFPRDESFTSPKFCGDAYLAIEELSKRHSGWNFVTLPIHPGLTIASRIPNLPPWISA
jgi:predicted O-methyltransferase YrrM